MEKLSKITKIFLFLFIIAEIIWLGSYITRLTLFYQLFEPNDYVLKSQFNDQNLAGIFQTLISAVVINLIFYLIMIISFIFFLFTSKLSLKQNGWLFIATILICLTLPFEIYLLLIDYNMIQLVFKSDFSTSTILTLVIDRFSKLSSFPIVEILAYFAVNYLFLFQPLKQKLRTSA